MDRAEVEGLLEVMEEDALFMDGYDEAIIGIGTHRGTGPFIVYSREKCIQILMDRDGATHEEAEEWFSYNSERGCLYAGEGAPIIVVTEAY